MQNLVSKYIFGVHHTIAAKMQANN